MVSSPGNLDRDLAAEVPADWCRITGRLPIDGRLQEETMAKGNNAQKKETKKPKKTAVKGASGSAAPKDTKKK